ncbi:MAG: hypothetical protein WC723_02855 [Candidatus Omnitrophota bacterium]
MRSNNGQSVLEYVIILTAVIAVIILAAQNIIRPAVNQIMTNAASSMNRAANQLP